MSTKTAPVTVIVPAVTDTTTELAKRRGRKPGQLAWSHEKIMARSNQSGIMDVAKAEWLSTVYGVEITPETMRMMILAGHSAVTRFWAESDAYTEARSDVSALEAEQIARKAAEDVAKVTATLSTQTLLSALTPEQIAAIVAAASK